MSKYSYTFCLWAAKHVHLFVFEKHFQFPPFAQFSCNQFKLASSASQRSECFLELLSHLVSNLKLGVVFACNNFHGITYLYFQTLKIHVDLKMIFRHWRIFSFKSDSNKDILHKYCCQVHILSPRLHTYLFLFLLSLVLFYQM